MDTRLTRRRFFQALAASALAAAVPLPIGFPTEPLRPMLPQGYYTGMMLWHDNRMSMITDYDPLTSTFTIDGGFRSVTHSKDHKVSVVPPPWDWDKVSVLPPPVVV